MDPSQLDQILANLFLNAQDAIKGVGKVTIETGHAFFDETYCTEHPGFVPGEYVQLTVSDNGCGMDHDTLIKLYEPFFTTKEMGKGTGLGLATVYGIVKQNNGFINVYSEVGQGTSFKIFLPRQAGKPAKMPVKNPRPARGHETILLVEDEPLILNLTTRMLEGQGYTVLAAATPKEALRLAEAHPGEIPLLCTDVVMPEMSGLDLVKILNPLPEHQVPVHVRLHGQRDNSPWGPGRGCAFHPETVHDRRLGSQGAGGAGRNEIGYSATIFIGLTMHGLVN